MNKGLWREHLYRPGGVPLGAGALGVRFTRVEQKGIITLLVDRMEWGSMEVSSILRGSSTGMSS